MPQQYLASLFERIAAARVVESGLAKSIDSWFSPFSEGIPGGHDVELTKWGAYFVTDFLGRRMQFVLLHCTMLGSKWAKQIESWTAFRDFNSLTGIRVCPGHDSKVRYLPCQMYTPVILDWTTIQLLIP